MPQAIFPGTFDPPNMGHLDVIERAAALFQPLYVAIGYNRLKPHPIFSVEERLQLLKKITAHIPSIHVVSFEGLLADFALEKEIKIIIRSIRNWSEFEQEAAQASMNHRMAPVETIYLQADEKYHLLSSSLIKEVLGQGKKLSGLVPPAIEEDVFNKFKKL